MKAPLNDYFHLRDAMRLSGPLSIGLMIKPAGASCPLACKYCYYGGGTKGMMTPALLERTIAQAADANDGPELLFNWHGGEPLLAGIDFYRQAVRLQKKYAGGRTVTNTIQTSGLPLNPRWAEFLRQENFLVGLSIDGPEEIHDAFRKDKRGAGTFEGAMRGLELLRRSGVEFNTLTTVNKASKGRGAEIYGFLKSAGSTYMQFLPVADGRPEDIDAEGFGQFMCEVYSQWVRKDVGSVFVSLFESTLASWCGLPRGLCTACETCGGSITVDWNGDAYACDHFTGSGYLLGNVGATSLRELATSPGYLQFCLRKRNALPRRCLECKYLFACGGECPGHRSASNGDAPLNALCEGYRMFFRESEASMLSLRDRIASGKDSGQG